MFEYPQAWKKNFTLERTQEEDTNGMGNLLEMLKMTQLQLFHCCYQKNGRGDLGQAEPEMSTRVPMDFREGKNGHYCYPLF